MESFFHEYISSTLDDEINEGLLERQLSPYATLRAGDLAALLRLQTPLPPLVNTNFNNNGNDFDDNIIIGCNKNKSTHDLDDEHKGAAFDRNDDDLNQDERKPITVICRGTDTNNSPAVYNVKGLRHHEMPVMGVCVDERICPGFQYEVRRISSDKFLYKTPKTLLSIGMGYGKRITFKGDSLNNNDCYFWSDSDPSGYAFSIHAVDAGQKLSILDADNIIVGEAIVDSINEPQVEMSSNVKDREITKRVCVSLNCSMKYYQRHNHGLVEMMVHEDAEIVTGVAVLKRNKSNKVALLTSIEEVFLERFGLCKFELDV